MNLTDHAQQTSINDLKRTYEVSARAGHGTFQKKVTLRTRKLFAACNAVEYRENTTQPSFPYLFVIEHEDYAG